MGGLSVGSFYLKGMRKVEIRPIGLKDSEQILIFRNELIKESLDAGGYIGGIKHVSRKKHADWMESALKQMRDGKSIYLIAELGDRVIGSGSIEKRGGALEHIADFGIGVLGEFTGMGLGKALTKDLIKLAKVSLKAEIIELGVFSDNKRAIRMYKKLGFKQYGKLKNGGKIKGVYKDLILMSKHLWPE